MCGILGEYTFGAPLADQKAFAQINRLSARRGPDVEGYAKPGAHCQLAHNRLAILDLSVNANQPMASPSGRYHIVYNGEIYNHFDIRRRLPRDYHHFKSHSDTETLVVAIEHFGFEQVIEWCDGMFAIAIYDSVEKQVWLARDFAGIKPLFYGWNGQTLLAASQYDQVMAHPAFRDEPVDPEVLKLYLEQHFLPAPFGLHRHTGQLRPGEIMRVDKEGKVYRRRYWELPVDVTPTVFDARQALDIVEAALNESTRAELLSDVPLGAFLSGGIDSPLVCYYAQKQATGKLKAFSIGSDSAVHDESADAAAYAALMGLEHHLERMDSGDALRIFQQVTEALHEPMADFSIIPTYLVSKLARRDVTVALSGDGGDELFFGYERFWSIAKNIGFHSLPYPAKYLAYGADRMFGRNRRINSAVLAATQGHAHRGLHSRFPKALMDALAPDLAQVATPEAYDVYDYPLTGDLPQLLGYMRRAEFYGMMQKTLRKVDLASMENSLEVRVPFLKKSFIEASLQIDPFLSYGPGRKKQVLKDLLRRNLPQSPIDDRKRGFSIPLSSWLRQGLKTMVEDVVLDKDRLHTWGFQSKVVHHMWKEHQEGVRDHKWGLFTLYGLLVFFEKLR